MIKKFKTKIDVRDLVRISLDLDKDAYTKLNRMCKKLNHTKNGLLRDFINTYYEDYFNNNHKDFKDEYEFLESRGQGTSPEVS